MNSIYRCKSAHDRGFVPSSTVKKVSTVILRHFSDLVRSVSLFVFTSFWRIFFTVLAASDNIFNLEVGVFEIDIGVRSRRSDEIIGELEAEMELLS